MAADPGAREIVMPRLSDTMEEGTILRWLKHDGEPVQRGEELVEIETDKANMTYESDLEGTLTIVAGEGATLAVGEVIALVDVVGAAAPAGVSRPADDVDGPASDGPASDGPAVVASPGSAREAAGASTPASAGEGTGGFGAAAAAGKASAATGSPERVRASPLARRLARERGVELREVAGSGPGGRIVKADVEGAAAGALATGTPASAVQGARAGTSWRAQASGQASIAGVATAKGETTTVELSRTQQTIARRMAESKATIPDFSIVVDVDMEECVKLRAELKRLSRPGPAAAGEEGSEVPTYNDMIVKACALALREHPRVNSSYRDGAVQLHSRVNVGVAVASEESLVVPTVFDADEKSLGEIAREARALVARVRAGTITPPELGGGTFTVSNLGMYGVRNFNAIINPPQVAILSVGSLQPRPVVVAGTDGAGLAVRHTLALTFVCDHRVLYGADAAQFAARVRELLQAPAALTL
ncbi:MAG TPA: dihydrolipoamide acetyltransferase family protein [Solirubrobacteraceae bacterium]|nr:dihydrolipoamide acetyltransferase family protein [Solirubrobacteraceae bacterium]